MQRSNAGFSDKYGLISLQQCAKVEGLECSNAAGIKMAFYLEILITKSQDITLIIIKA